MRKLTEKQKLFVKHYLISLNASKAALKAGYSKKSAPTIGFQLLQKTIIQDAIAAGAAKRDEKLDRTAADVLADINRVRMKAEAAGEYNNALKASELEGRHRAMFTDRQIIDERSIILERPAPRHSKKK